MSPHAILVVRGITSKTKDTIMLSVEFEAIMKWRFFLKTYSIEDYIADTNMDRESAWGTDIEMHTLAHLLFHHIKV